MVIYWIANAFGRAKYIHLFKNTMSVQFSEDIDQLVGSIAECL